MSDELDKKRREEDEELTREIRRGRKFSLEEAIAELAGPGGMKGASPIAQLEQAEVEIANWLRLHLTDNSGALAVVLHRSVRESELLLNNSSQPLVVLCDYCRRVLASEFLLSELVRRADVEWGRTMDERPMFETPGTPALAGDPYTLESVRAALSGVLSQLSGGRS
jgi:hypothetical protein